MIHYVTAWLFRLASTILGLVTYEQNDTAYYVEIKNKENVQVNESAETLLHRELIGSGHVLSTQKPCMLFYSSPLYSGKGEANPLGKYTHIFAIVAAVSMV